MLDENDMFIINGCIKNIPYEMIANSFNWLMQALEERLEKIEKLIGIKPYPGMEGSILKSKDITIFNLLHEGKSPEEIVVEQKLDSINEVYKTTKKFSCIRGKETMKEEEKDEKINKRYILSDEQQAIIIKMINEGNTVNQMVKAIGIDRPNFFIMILR